jgi:hypothetical protein
MAVSGIGIRGADIPLIQRPEQISGPGSLSRTLIEITASNSNSGRWVGL